MTTRSPSQDSPEEWFLKIQKYTSERARLRVESKILLLRDALELEDLMGVVHYADLPELLSVMLYSKNFQKIKIKGVKYNLTLVVCMDLTEKGTPVTYLLRSVHGKFAGVGRTFLNTKDFDEILVFLNKHLPI
jgi:hypothetical protein